MTITISCQHKQEVTLTHSLQPFILQARDQKSHLRGGEPALGARQISEHAGGLHDEGHEEVGERRQEAGLVDAVVENI